MRIIVIAGSPRSKGNTARVISMFEDIVKENHEVETIRMTKHKVGGCLGCCKCQENREQPGCVQDDDASTIFAKLMEADAIVYATPLYCWSFTSQMKPLIDRHFCLVTGYGTPNHASLIGDKAAALLVTCAGPIEGNCDAIQGIFNGICGYGKLVSKGNYILPFCSTPDEIGADGEALAGDLAKAIIAG